MSCDATGDDKSFLTRAALRRVLVSLIAAEQAPRMKFGAIGPEVSVVHRTLGLPLDSVDDLPIDEATLGFDSLATLDLILRVNQFFGLHQTGVEDYLLVNRRIGAWLDLINQHCDLLSGNITLTFQTSGSAGPPKAVPFDIATLAAEVKAQLNGPFAGARRGARVIALVPPHHIYGFLFSCLMPSMAGLDVVDLHHKVPSSAFAIAKKEDLIVATPHIWRHLGQSGQSFASGVCGVTSGGPSDAATWALRETAGLASMTEIYGATETGGIGFRTAPDDPFTLLQHLQRSEDGVRCAGSLLPLQDRIAWSGPRAFDVLGRCDDVIQVGGVNVSPAYVTDVIAKIPGVAEAVVRVGDTRLRAFIVPAQDITDQPAFAARVRREIAARLDAVARPEAITFGPTLPRTPMGKLADWV